MFHDTGAPYTAMMVMTVTFPASPGSSEMKSLSASTFQARDSAGRTRTEESKPRPGGNGTGMVEVHVVSVNDPVSHCSFQWEEPWVVTGTPGGTVRCMPRRVQFNQPDVWVVSMKVGETRETYPNEVDVYRTEAIGERVFEGVEASGVRRTKTVTNLQTKEVRTLVSELWYSTELREVMEMKEVPAGAEIPDFKLTKIHRGEPDEALFYPPAGYKMVHY